MMTNIDEFAHEFFQDVISRADAAGHFMEDVFFETFCDYLMAAGEIDGADRAFYLGPGTTGIRVDGYALDDNTGTLSLIISDFRQSPKIERLTGSEMNTIFERPSRFLRRSLDAKWRNALEETSPGFGLADLVSQRWRGIDKVRLILISNRELSERVDGREAAELDGKTTTYNVWDIRRLHRFVTAGHGREDINIDLTDFGGPLPVLPAHLPDVDYESFLAVVPGTVLARIYDRWGARLLEQNVRVFLQARGNVNKGIRNTLQGDPSMFFAYNNGITCTAEEVSVEDATGSMLLRRLKNLQIVNGGQTTASIHHAHRNSANLASVFVQMKLSVVAPERTEEVVPKISEFANSQNRVNAADFFANHPFHVRIESFSRRIYAPSPDGTFRESKWFYERARGQYADARSLLTTAERRKFDLENPRTQVFSKTDLAKFLNIWLGLPHTVSLGAQKNFAYFARSTGEAWDSNPDDFNEAWYRETVAKAIIFRCTEKIVSDQPWYQGGYRANVVAYAIAKLAHDVAKMKLTVDFDSIWRRQSPSPAMGTTLAGVAHSVHEVLTNPPPGISNVTEWAKQQACWVRVSELGVRWSEGFIDELITQEDSQSADRTARRDQKMLNGITAQSAIVEAGGAFWQDALSWASRNRLLTPKEAGVLDVAKRIPTRLPSEAQSLKVLEVLKKLQAEGYHGSLGEE